jgi:AraC family transcriptional activator of pobA
MHYKGKINEQIFISPIVPERDYMFDKDLKTGLSIIWNVEEKATLIIDNQAIEIEKNCILFVTEYHQITEIQFEKLNVIQFNRAFHCIRDHDQDIGCKGLLFFGASEIPKIVIPKEKTRHFQSLWDIFIMEIDEQDAYKLDMLRSLLKRFLILCTRIYKKERFDIHYDNKNIGLIREYNYLVEQHYKTLTKVGDYAKILYKSPKTLSNVFKKYIDKTPLQIINERRLLEAKRLLNYSDSTIQEIAESLNFNDIQAFSNFFKKHTKMTPSAFRK